MKEIRISTTAQTGLLLALLGAVIAMMAAQEPEIRRYLKMKSM